MREGQHPIVGAMENAALRDHLAGGGACEQCGSQALKCTNRAFIVDTMFEDFECLSCGHMNFTKIENY